MWKLAIGFVLFAALTLFILSRGGEVDMSGEKHGTETSQPTPAAAPAAATALAASAAK